MGFLGIIFRTLFSLAGPTVILLYPLYASVQAIDTLDDQQWLTYWIIYSFITLFELSFWSILEWFPLWPYIKILICLWLNLPKFNGATFIYQKIVRTYVNVGTKARSNKAGGQPKVLQMMKPDTIKTVESNQRGLGN
ncbi:HVA22-like protein f [Abeliophyllum distichum]|uniref:HVA22-like protein n=1 Tax=Abeliophyllum distichum TaxID=126358 RepID=A0ABD1QK59_9LAMI